MALSLVFKMKIKSPPKINQLNLRKNQLKLIKSQLKLLNSLKIKSKALSLLHKKSNLKTRMLRNKHNHRLIHLKKPLNKILNLFNRRLLLKSKRKLQRRKRLLLKSRRNK